MFTNLIFKFKDFLIVKMMKRLILSALFVIIHGLIIGSNPFKGEKCIVKYTWNRKQIKHVVLNPAKIISRPFQNGEWPEE